MTTTDPIYHCNWSYRWLQLTLTIIATAVFITATDPTDDQNWPYRFLQLPLPVTATNSIDVTACIDKCNWLYLSLQLILPVTAVTLWIAATNPIHNCNHLCPALQPPLPITTTVSTCPWKQIYRYCKCFYFSLQLTIYIYIYIYICIPQVTLPIIATYSFLFPVFFHNKCFFYNNFVVCSSPQRHETSDLAHQNSWLRGYRNLFFRLCQGDHWRLRYL